MAKHDITEKELPVQAPAQGPVFKEPDPVSPSTPPNKGAAIPPDEPQSPFKGHMPGAAVPDPLYVAPRSAGRTMEQIISEFVAAVAAHPDGQILTSAIGGTPSDQHAQMFPHTPIRNMHTAEIRVLFRDAQRQDATPEPEKPWKWAHVVGPHRPSEPSPERQPIRRQRETALA